MTRNEIMTLEFKNVNAENKNVISRWEIDPINTLLVLYKDPAIIGTPTALYDMAVSINGATKNTLINFKDKQYHLFGLDIPFEGVSDIDADLIIYSQSSDDFKMLRFYSI